MKTSPMKATTAILAVLSLTQTAPVLAQSAISNNKGQDGSFGRQVKDADARTFAKICAEAGITKEAECKKFTDKVRPEARAGSANAADNADAATEGQANADAVLADASADTATETQADEDTTQADAETDTSTEMQTDDDTTSMTTEAERLAETCMAEVIDVDGVMQCTDTLTPANVAALAADTEGQADSEVEVTTETVTENTRRSSDEEFDEGSQESGATVELEGDAQSAAESDSGMSDLERTGLVALSGLIVGTLLANGQEVQSNTGDRVIVSETDGNLRVLKDDNALLRQPGSEVRTERFQDGSSRTTVTHEDGTRIVTIRDSSGRALQRMLVEPDGREYALIDDTRTFEEVRIRDLPSATESNFNYTAASERDSLRRAMLASDQRQADRGFSLHQVRTYSEVRELVPQITLEPITFATDSAALLPSRAANLEQMGLIMREMIADDPTELFLIEGYTDAVGEAGYNLLLSDRRAETVALALNEYFGVPAENMVVQGYGERFLRVQTQNAERQNRRVSLRRITSLTQSY